MITRCVYGAGFSLLIVAELALAKPARDCPQIVSNVERLACFDEAAGTPARMTRQEPGRAWSAPEYDIPSVFSVMASEATRAPDDLTFHLSVRDEGARAQQRLLITAPAIASVEPRPYLAISCVQSISRLQLVTGQPIDANWVKVQLQGARGSTSATPWQVMENGQLLDAGRGLPAIEQIKKLIGAHRIQVISDHPVVDGLTFDAQGLDLLIDHARQSCRW